MYLLYAKLITFRKLQWLNFVTFVVKINSSANVNFMIDRLLYSGLFHYLV